MNKNHHVTKNLIAFLNEENLFLSSKLNWKDIKQPKKFRDFPIENQRQCLIKAFLLSPEADQLIESKIKYPHLIHRYYPGMYKGWQYIKFLNDIINLSFEWLESTDGHIEYNLYMSANALDHPEDFIHSNTFKKLKLKWDKNTKPSVIQTAYLEYLRNQENIIFNSHRFGIVSEHEFLDIEHNVLLVNKLNGMLYTYHGNIEDNGENLILTQGLQCMIPLCQKYDEYFDIPIESLADVRM